MEGETKQQVEQRSAEQRTSPSGRIVYKAILQEGREELERSSVALFWSGFAAGLSMGFSLISEGLIRHCLPESKWQMLVSNFGYSVDYLLVILGRQQLFTENTLTPILPLLQEKRLATLRNVLRLWMVVLVANLVGAVAISWVASQTGIFDEAVRREFLAFGQEAMARSTGNVLLRGILAGWLIALLVWLLPFAESGRIWVIIILTYLVGLGRFSHVIAGSIEAFVLGFSGSEPWSRILLGYVLPAFVGNTVGGVTLVAALNHAQVVAGGGGQDI
jgi:formate/nitrite transporter FocA (FNT family)